jgi:hypothetical protein
MGVAVISGRCGPGDRANDDDLPGTLLLHDRSDSVARVDGPEQIHRHDKLQQRRIKGACLGIDGPTATAACIRDRDIDPTPLLDDVRDQCLDRLMVTDIELDP